MRLFYSLLFFPIFSMAQFDLTVTITNIKSTDGKISIAVYDNSKDFLKFDKVFKAVSAPAEKGSTSIVIEDLPKGTYALAAFHDQNNNDKLNTNFLGIPKEPLGFSIGKLKTFGPPSFSECSFSVTSDKEISIPLSN